MKKIPTVVMEKIRDHLPVRIISLPQSKERQQWQHEQMEKERLKNWQFIPGIPGDRLDNDRIRRAGFRFSGSNPMLKRNEIGCFLAHTGALRRILQDGSLQDHDWFLVLEDDAIISPQLDFNQLLEELPPNWDLCWLSNVEQDPPGVKDLSEHLCFPSFLWCCAGLLWSKRGAKKFLRFALNDPLKHFPVDTYLSILGRSGHLNVVAPKRRVVDTDKSQFTTTIGSRTEEHPFITESLRHQKEKLGITTDRVLQGQKVVGIAVIVLVGVAVVWALYRWGQRKTISPPP